MNERPGVLFNEADVMEFAEGRAANVFGRRFESIDELPRRVRLPGPPFLAVSRVTDLSGSIGELKGARIRTEFDIPNPGWSAVDGQASSLSLDPQGVQFLAAWLGVDFENRGERSYRWVEGRMTHHGGMPKAGQTVVTDIRIVQCVRVNGATLCRVECKAVVDDRPVLTVDRCVVGFFSDADLAQGDGMDDGRRLSGAPPRVFAAPLVPLGRPLDGADLLALSRGQIAEVMSPAHANGGRNPSLRIAPAIAQFIDRVSLIEHVGGAHGLGRSEAEVRVDPRHWAVRAHFKDDPVYPGPCMVEGATQLLQIHALSMGLQTTVSGGRFQPILNRPTLARFRSQVLARNQVLGFRADVIEVGLVPEPYLIADVDLIDNCRVVGRIENLGVRMSM